MQHGADKGKLRSVDPDSVRRQLERILAYPALQSNHRRREMLRYIVEETLAGRASRIKAYTIATSVMGRRGDFDQQTDPLVRIEGRRLRRDLDNYYATVGASDPIRIEIPKGRYVPLFHEIASRAETHDDEIDAHAADITPDARPSLIKRSAVLAAAVILGILAGVLLLSTWQRLSGEIAVQETGDASGRIGPSLLITPFEAPGDSDRNAIFAAGITHELINNLLKFPYLRVFSVSSSFSQEGKDAIAAAKELNSSYVVAGTIRTDESQALIEVKLMQSDNSLVLWSESYQRSLSTRNLMDIERDISSEIATIIGQPYGLIRNEVALEASGTVDPDLESYACVLSAYTYRRTSKAELYRPTRDCLETAVKRDPDYAEAWAMVTYLRLDAGRYGYDPGVDSDAAYLMGRSAATKALSIDPNNVEALKALSFIDHYTERFEQSQELARKAVAVNPNNPDNLAQLGWRLSVRGNRAEGIPLLKQAVARSVQPAPWYFQMIAIDHLMRGEYDKMLEASERAAADGSSVSYSLLAIAHGALGHETAASENLAKMAERWPLMAADPAAAYSVHKLDKSMVDAIVQGLRNAGWASVQTVKEN